MEQGGVIGSGSLELRRAARDGSRRLKGRFPYGKRAVLSDGGRTGRPRKEMFAPKAFAYRVERPEEEIHLLIGHDYDRPLASRKAGTLFFNDSPEALTFEAVISAEMQEVSYVADFFKAFAAGLILGISPGFRIPPERAVPNAEATEEEDPAEGMALIRTIFAALLFEMSLVTAPVYKEAAVEERTAGGLILPDGPTAGLQRTLARWRA